jgi:hypothetical protein
MPCAPPSRFADIVVSTLIGGLTLCLVAVVRVEPSEL